jgi:biotin synthase
MSEIIDIVAADPENSPFHRMCISMITHPRSEEDTFTVLRQWTDRIDPDAIPVSILSNPTTMTRKDVQKTRDMGADIFTVALDAATPEVFDRTRGKGVQSPHKWSKYWEILQDAKDIFGPQKFGAHIIVGTRRSRRTQPHVLLFPGTGLTDGSPAGNPTGPMAARAAGALPDRLSWRAREPDAVR